MLALSALLARNDMIRLLCIALFVWVLVTGYANAADVAPSAPSGAELAGVQLIRRWSEPERAVAELALGVLEDKHRKDPDGITDYLLARAHRITPRIENGGFAIFDATIYGWHRHRVRHTPYRELAYSFSLPEDNLLEYGVSNARECMWWQQDMEEDLAKQYCATIRKRATRLSGKFISELRADTNDRILNSIFFERFHSPFMHGAGRITPR